MAAFTVSDHFQTDAKDVAKMRQRLDRFVAFLGDASRVADLTTAKIDSFLSSLVDLRTVNRRTPNQLANGKECGSDQKVNRYRTVIGGLCTWAIRANRLERHPIAGKRVQKRAEPHHRLPELSPDEYATTSPSCIAIGAT